MKKFLNSRGGYRDRIDTSGALYYLFPPASRCFPALPRTFISIYTPGSRNTAAARATLAPTSAPRPPFVPETVTESTPISSGFFCRGGDRSLGHSAAGSVGGIESLFIICQSRDHRGRGGRSAFVITVDYSSPLRDVLYHVPENMGQRMARVTRFERYFQSAWQKASLPTKFLIANALLRGGRILCSPAIHFRRSLPLCTFCAVLTYRST